MEENKKIDEFISTLAEISQFLAEIKRRNVEMQPYQASEAVEKILNGFTFSPFHGETPEPQLGADAALQLNNTRQGKFFSEEDFIIFTEKELKSMPKNISRILNLDGKRCHIRKRKCGNSFTYEIRFRRDFYNINACGKTVELAKKNFLQKCVFAKPQKLVHKNIPTTFEAFSSYYFDTFRKPKLSEETFYHNQCVFKRHILPAFGDMPIRKINPAQCKALLDGILAKGQGRTAEDVKSLLSQTLNSAIAHGIIERNPLDLVFYVKHERQTGTVLTQAEQDELLSKLSGTVAGVAAALSLYCGLRPNEWHKCEIKGDFIVSVNSKRKTKKVQYKRIPICTRLKPFLANGIPAFPNYESLHRAMKAVLPNHSPKDLRKTFNSKCKELGISDHARHHFMGHSEGALDQTYTYLSDEYLITEGKKLNKW
ncbi:MAG: tyrosine-type recombinase/integrase family protein [Clostridia bacterium]|nr:tyrosine-type recombinase/integrase family protein [Clostridia bacterium]